MACLNSLPVELLHLICTHLNSKEVLELTMANRYFNTFLYSNLFQNVIISSPRSLQLFIDAIQNGNLKETSFGLKTRTLKLAYTPITGQQLTTLLNGCPRIMELDLDNYMWHFICPTKRSDPWNPGSETFRNCLNVTFNRYKHLTSLSLNLAGYMSQTINIHHILSLLSGLHSLKLLNVFHVFTMADMEKIHAHCPRLKDLTVSGFCLNRGRPALPITQTSTLRHLSLQFSSGWSYYYHWLWYIGCKYTSLSTLICECTASMGIHGASATDEQDMIDGFNIFAQQHALTLQKLEFSNLVIDARLLDALRISNVNDAIADNINNNDTTVLMDWEMDGKHEEGDGDQTTMTTDVATPTIPAPPTTAITNARFSNRNTSIQPEIFLSILQYVQQTIRTLNISWPPMKIDDTHLCDSLSACIFLTNLTIEIPSFLSGAGDDQGVVPFDRILQSCPLLTKLHIKYGKIVLVNDSMTTDCAHHQLNHPLKHLDLHTVYIPSCFMVMENYGLLSLECISLDHCTIYDLSPTTLLGPTILLDWLFPIPPPPPPDGDSILTVPCRPLAISLYHTHFRNHEDHRTYMDCDSISLSQHGKGEEDSWIIQSSYAQKSTRMSSAMLRRKTGQVKRKNNRRQVPSDIYDVDVVVTPKVGILISCHSVDSLRVNGRELL